MTGSFFRAVGNVERRIHDLEDVVLLDVFDVCVAWFRRSLRLVFSFEGSSTNCMPNMSLSVRCAEANTFLKDRPCAFESLKTLADMSLRRSGVREYSVDSARRTSFLTSVDSEFVVCESEAAAEEEMLDAADVVDEER